MNMNSMEKQKNCFYLDSSMDPAVNMLRSCVSDPNSISKFDCGGSYEVKIDKDTARMNDIMIQRGFTSFRIDEYAPSVSPQIATVSSGSQPEIHVGHMEGFVSGGQPGEKTVPKGSCPEGHTWSPKTGICVEVCQGCVYRDNMKSQQFNEADPCFPGGTYDGITNDGNIKCTCGKDNQYCSHDFIKNTFTADGMMMMNNKVMMNVGLTKSINNLFSYDYL
jgi:hypothetical protein